MCETNIILLDVSGAVLAGEPILNIKETLLAGWQKRQVEHRRSGPIHLSDLLYCRRKVAFDRINETVPAVSSKSFKAMYNGEEKHRVLQSVLDQSEWECEKELVYRNGGIEIVCHPDMIHKKSGVIIEIKSTIRIPKQPYTNHLRQLKGYIAIASALGYNVPYGKLLYLVLGSNEEDPEYSVTVTEEEKNEILETFSGDAAELTYAIDSKDASLVEGVFNDPKYLNYRKINWMCSSCPHFYKCLNIHYGQKK